MSEKLSRAPMTHTVKCVPPFFEEVWTGRKGFEIRLNDRDFRDGDTIIQREYLPDAQEYTGRETAHRVGYVLRDYPALAENHVAFTLLPCAARAEARPVDMVLHCPACGLQHIDEATPEWDNPPHRSHLCLGCGHIWRPSDVATNGVVALQTRGKSDSPLAEGRPAPVVDREAVEGVIEAADDAFIFSRHIYGRDGDEEALLAKQRELGDIIQRARATLSPATSPGEGSSGAESARTGTLPVLTETQRSAGGGKIPSVEEVIRYLRNYGPGTPDTTDLYFMRWAADHLCNLVSREAFWRSQAQTSEAG